MNQFYVGVWIAVVSIGLWACSDDKSNTPSMGDLSETPASAGIVMSPPAKGGSPSTMNGDQSGGQGSIDGDHNDDVPTPGSPIPDGPTPNEVDYPAAEPPILRLTINQITHSLHDIFGDSITIPSVADPDMIEGGFKTVGSALSVPSTRGVESIEKMAYAVSAEVVSPSKRDETIGCDPAEDDCVKSFIERRGRQVWRRPLTQEEFERLFNLFLTVKTRMESPFSGLEFVVAALIQSPHFIFRKEVAIDGRYTDYALASRLSYLLWDTTPDDVLLDAAESGTLTTDDGLRSQIDRMLASPRAEAAILRFFEQWFDLEKLKHLNKDPIIFTAMTSDLGEMARRETLLNIAEVIFTEDSDLRNLLTRERTFVNRKLAAMYGIRAPVRDGFGSVQLTRQSHRRGLLGQVSFLALHSHPVSTSATLRGLFVRTHLLCQTVPPPPADVDTSIPEPSGQRQTLRERVDEHLTSEACRGCHLLTDPIGLAFENFDGIGIYRTTDNGGIIDPSGDFDGRGFEDAWSIAESLRTHPNFPGCVVRNLHRFITGRIESDGQKPMLAALTRQFAKNTYRFKPLLVGMLMSRIFRNAGAVDGAQP